MVNLLQTHCALVFFSQLDACETASFYLYYFRYFSLEVLPKKCNFWGVGSLKRLNLRNRVVHLNAVSDLDSQDAGLSETGHVFELRPAVQEP